MKKLLSLIGSFGLIISFGLNSVVSCQLMGFDSNDSDNSNNNNKLIELKIKDIEENADVKAIKDLDDLPTVNKALSNISIIGVSSMTAILKSGSLCDVTVTVTVASGYSIDSNNFNIIGAMKTKNSFAHIDDITIDTAKTDESEPITIKSSDGKEVENVKASSDNEWVTTEIDDATLVVTADYKNFKEGDIAKITLSKDGYYDTTFKVTNPVLLHFDDSFEPINLKAGSVYEDSNKTSIFITSNGKPVSGIKLSLENATENIQSKLPFDVKLDPNDSSKILIKTIPGTTQPGCCEIITVSKKGYRDLTLNVNAIE